MAPRRGWLGEAASIQSVLSSYQHQSPQNRGHGTICCSGLRDLELHLGQGNSGKTQVPEAKGGEQRQHVHSTPQKATRNLAAAIKLASDIGIEYLWVDSVCIDQENSFEKQVQLANMAEIYGRAMVCLVAAAGDNMDFGLPGFSKMRTQDAQSPLYTGL